MEFIDTHKIAADKKAEKEKMLQRKEEIIGLIDATKK
jgi:hypothetical protein